MNNPSSFNTMPFSLDTNVTDPSKDERTYPHGQIRYSRKSACCSDVELQHISHVLWKICHHCIIAPIVANLETAKFNFISEI